MADKFQNFLSLLSSGEHSDYTISASLGGGKAQLFKVHKLIISQNSEYFKEECYSGTAAFHHSDGSRINLELLKCEPEFFEQILEFLYTGKWLSKNQGTIVDWSKLLLYADFFKVIPLKIAIFNRIIKALKISKIKRAKRNSTDFFDRPRNKAKEKLLADAMTLLFENAKLFDDSHFKMLFEALFACDYWPSLMVNETVQGLISGDHRLSAIWNPGVAGNFVKQPEISNAEEHYMKVVHLPTVTHESERYEESSSSSGCSSCSETSSESICASAGSDSE